MSARTLCLFLLFPFLCAGQPARLARMNFNSFTAPTRAKLPISGEAASRISRHPEGTILPYSSAPCKDCYEDVYQRSSDNRFFIRETSSGNYYYQQRSASPINYLDKDGFWREINYRLKHVNLTSNRFHAPDQPYPVTVDLSERYTSIQFLGKEFRFNRNIRLLHRSGEGILTSLGEGNWNDFTSGDDGIRINDFYPGVDLIFALREGQLESSFILHRPLPLKDGELILDMECNLPDGYEMKAEKEGSMKYGAHGALWLVDADGVPAMEIQRCFAFDGNPEQSKVLPLSSVWKTDQHLQVAAPVSWLNDINTQYPVQIDPIVTTQGILNSGGASGVTGTRYSPVCWTNGCDYSLTVPTPANAELIRVLYSFEYYAVTGACVAQDGGYSIQLGGCTAPTAAPGVFTCPVASTNYNCGQTGADITADLAGCLPPSQCASQNLNFTLHFYRCNNDPDTSCSPNCIRSSQPWIMTLEGRDLEIPFVSGNQQVCEGDTAVVTAIAQYGIGPYSFIWMPFAYVNDTIWVTPATTTSYTVSVTDACGTVRTASSDVTILPGSNPGFVINPANVCTNEAVSLTGNGAFPASSYDWIVPGSSAPGGVINNSRTPVIQYTIPGTYYVTLNFQSGTCFFAQTDSVIVNAPAPAAVALNASPPGAVCPGDRVLFTAVTANGGSAPVYSFLINGIVQQTGPVDTFGVSTLSNGDIVQVVLNSSSSCVSPSVDTASLFMTVSGTVTPFVTMTPDTAVCPGTAVTFTASPTNGGVTPTYQWTVNGNVIAGAVNASFTYPVTTTDTLIGVTMISSLSCVTSSFAADSSAISYLVQADPVVSLSSFPAGSVCSGQNVLFEANPLNAGDAPVFEWFVNGVSQGAGSYDSTFSFTAVNNGDLISVEVTGNSGCVLTSNVANANSSVSVSPAVAPSVVVVAANDTICSGESVQFNAQSSGAGPAPVFGWYVNGVFTGETDSLFATASLLNGDRVRVVVTSSLSCATVPADTDEVVMTVIPIETPSAVVTPAASGLCQGDPVTLVATVSNAGSQPSFLWYVNGRSTGVSNDTLTGSYTDGDQITFLVVSSSACPSVDSLITSPFLVVLSPVVVPALSILSTAGDTLCTGQEVIINALPVNGGLSPVFQWYLNGILTSVTGSTFTSSSLGQGDVVQAVVTSSAPCASPVDATSNTLRFNVFPPLNLSMSSPSQVCPGTPVTVSASGSGGDGGPYVYLWEDFVTSDDSVTLIADQTRYVAVTVRDACGSSPVSDSSRVIVLPAPVSDYIYRPTDLSTYYPKVQFTNITSNSVLSKWYFGDGDSSTVFSPMHAYSGPGTFQVTLVSTGSNGCSDTISYQIVVKEDLAVFFPNAFSPNGDDKNEYWEPVGISLTDYEFTIWDRWGRIAFEGKPGKPWPGTFMDTSEKVPPGVYTYRVDLKDPKFDEQIVTGRVTLIW